MNVLCEKFLKSVRRFVVNEQGAVSLDWVILTAGVVVMAIGLMTMFRVTTPGELYGDVAPGEDPRPNANFISLLLFNTDDAVQKFGNTLRP